MKNNRSNYGNSFGMKCFYSLLKYSGIYSAYFLLAFVFPFYALRPDIQKSASFYLKKRFKKDPLLSRVSSVYTIHNLMFQFGKNWWDVKNGPHKDRPKYSTGSQNTDPRQPALRRLH